MIRPIAIVPARDNDQSIGEVVRRTLEHLPDVVVVDDGSTDATGDHAQAAGAKVLSHPINLGKGSALLTGFRYGAKRGFTHAITLDADLQHDPDELPSFLSALAEAPDALLIGARDMHAAPAASRIAQAASNIGIRASTGHWVQDSQSGYRGYPLLTVLKMPLQGGRYEFETEVLTRWLWERRPLIELSCSVWYPEHHPRRLGGGGGEEGPRVTSFRPVVDTSRIVGRHLRHVGARLRRGMRRRLGLSVDRKA